MRSRRLALAIVLTLLLAASIAATASSAGNRDGGRRAEFRLADGSAACRYDSGVLACRNRAPGAAVRLAGTGTVVVKNIPVDWDRRTPVVRSWSRGGISCKVARAIRCENRTGTQLVVGGQTIAVLAPPAVSP